MNVLASGTRPAEAGPASVWGEIYTLLREEGGVDFSTYQQSGARRRILRQMRLRRFATLPAYVHLLHRSATERKILFREMLAPATNFRELPALASWQRAALPALRNRAPGTPLRVWVPGCSSGEEAYSIALLLAEILNRKHLEFPIQIFATDVDDEALQKARAGKYSARLAERFSRARLKRFFVSLDNGYRINDQTRRQCIFAHHNLGVDPPLARMDLISCQNVLNHLGPELRQRAIRQFHFALSEQGFLLLGPSEAFREQSGLFTQADKASHLFAKVSPDRVCSGGTSQASADAESRAADDELRAASAEIKCTAEELEAVSRELGASKEELEGRRRDLRLVQQTILDSLSAQVAVLDRTGTIVLANNSWRRATHEHRCFCIARAERGYNYLQLCRDGGTHGAEVLEGIRSVLDRSRESFARDFPCHSATGEHWFLLSVTPLADPEGGVVISRTEITEQRRADVARAQLAAIVESSSDAITAATLDGKVMSWNHGAERLYGYSAAEMVGRSIRRLVPRNRRHELESVFERLRGGAPIATFDTMRRRKDGRLVAVALSISALCNSRGQIIGASGIARDVSERDKLQAEVLRAAEREQRRIAQDLHDGLGQQIAGTACLADVLQQSLKADRSPQAPAAAKIARLLNDAAMQSRSLARGLYPVPPNPHGLVSALQALAARTQELFGVACEFKHTRSVSVSNANVANHLYRIAQEAVTNAIRHGRCRHIEIQLSANRVQIVLGVRDDGVGLRVSRQRRPGIGLRIMNYRANLIAGTLVVQHGPKNGTEIICTVHRRSHENFQITPTT